MNEDDIEIHWNLEIDSNSYMLKKSILSETGSTEDVLSSW